MKGLLDWEAIENVVMSRSAQAKSVDADPAGT